MKYALLIPLSAALFAASGYSQERIYRCGNEYTNTVSAAQAKDCKLMAGGNLTVVQGTRPAPVRLAAATQAGQRIDAADQRSRDSDVRLILEAELKKAEARQGELLKEYNNGEPEKRGDETRNHQKYLDRVAELKAGLMRNENDIAGIRRELGRVPATASK